MAEHLKFKPIIAPYSSIADEEQTLYRALTTLKRLFVLTDHTKEIDLINKLAGINQNNNK